MIAVKKWNSGIQCLQVMNPRPTSPEVQNKGTSSSRKKDFILRFSASVVLNLYIVESTTSPKSSISKHLGGQFSINLVSFCCLLQSLWVERFQVDNTKGLHWMHF